MAILTVFLIPFYMDIFFWIPIFLICAYIIAKKAYDSYFLHGLWTGIAIFLWVTLIHVLLFTKYIFANGPMVGILSKLPKIASPRVMLIIYLPLLGVACGIIIGLLSVLASKFVQRKDV